MLAVALPKGSREATMCKAFGSTLTGPALQWYINLPSKSIASFAVLSDKFVEQLASSRDLEKTSDSLYEILQHRAEPLRGYIAHFNQEKVAIPECSIPTAISDFKRVSEMAKTKGGGQVGSCRSRRNQGLKVVDPTPQVASATTLKVKKRTTKKTTSPKKNLVLTPTRRSSRIKKVAAQDDEVEDVTLDEDDEVEDVTPAQDDEVEDEADQAEKAMSEDDKDDAGIEGEDEEDGVLNEKENEEEAANMEDDGVLNEKANEEEALDMEEDGVSNEKGNEEEALNMGEDGVSNAQDDEIPSTEGVELPGDEVKEKNKRGPIKMRRVAENPNEKIMVTFNDFGDHIGPGSVTLSSFLCPLVREHVPVTLADWRNLDAATKATMWEEIQGRFNLQEEWQKAVIFKQLGNLWRAGKSRLVSQVRAAKTAAERIDLKPSNIPSIQVWNSWDKSKTTKTFTEVSNKYREMRKNQIPHTTSRKGMLRLAEDMSKDPSKVSRSKVWIVGNTHADGRPVKPHFAETIVKIIEVVYCA
ncbi:hypothetical protein Bca101_074688 [Brassica carinata]